MAMRIPHDWELLEMVSRADADGSLAKFSSPPENEDGSPVSKAAKDQQKAKAAFLSNYNPKKILEFIRELKTVGCHADPGENVILQALRLWHILAQDPTTTAATRIQAQAKIIELAKSCAMIHPDAVRELGLADTGRKKRSDGDSPYALRLKIAQGA